MGERFSTFFIYREEYHGRRDSNGANWHVAPFLASPSSSFRPSKEFEPCTYPSLVRRNCRNERGSSSPDSRVLWFSRRIGGKNFGGNNHVGRWKLIHQVDKRHNFHARREKQFYRRVNYALFFSFFQLYIEIGSRNWPRADVDLFYRSSHP